MPAMHFQGIRVYRRRYCLASGVLSNALVQDIPLTNLQPARPGHSTRAMLVCGASSHAWNEADNVLGPFLACSNNIRQPAAGKPAIHSYLDLTFLVPFLHARHLRPLSCCLLLVLSAVDDHYQTSHGTFCPILRPSSFALHLPTLPHPPAVSFALDHSAQTTFAATTQSTTHSFPHFLLSLYPYRLRRTATSGSCWPLAFITILKDACDQRYNRRTRQTGCSTYAGKPPSHLHHTKTHLPSAAGCTAAVVAAIIRLDDLTVPYTLYSCWR